MMAMASAFGSHNGFCTCAAAACTSARILDILDTVIILAVSIFVRLVSLRLWVS